MARTTLRLAAVARAAGLAACADSGSDTLTGNSSDLAITNGFATMPVGYDQVENTFGNPGDSTGWRPDGMGRHGPGGGMGGGGMGGGPGGQGGPGGLMGGGLGGFFGPGHDFHLGRGWLAHILNGTCAFDAASGRFLCPDQVRDGLTITRSVALYDALGAVQSAWDTATTDKVNIQKSVSGTTVRWNGDTAVVSHASDRTIAGLLASSTQRILDGTSAGTETLTGTDTAGTFTATRTVGDTLVGVTLPKRVGRGVYPLAGSITRSMAVSVTYAGSTTLTRSRREVLTFDGSAIASLVITQDGVTKTCTVPLPHGRPSCS